MFGFLQLKYDSEDIKRKLELIYFLQTIIIDSL